MSSSSARSEPPPPDSSEPDRPPWAGHWRVIHYDGATPERPTYYDATPTSWDVLTQEEDGLSVARHPILEIRRNRLVLKDEGEPDENTETWRVEVTDDHLRVTALTGPHEGAVGIAVRPVSPAE